MIKSLELKLDIAGGLKRLEAMIKKEEICKKKGHPNARIYSSDTLRMEVWMEKGIIVVSSFAQ